VLNGTAYPVLSSDYKISGKSSGARANGLLEELVGAAIGAIAGNAGMGAAIALWLEHAAVVQKGQK